MSDELLHLNDHETVRLVRERPEELEVEGTWTPGGAPRTPHLHPARDEHFEVRSGRLVAVVEGEQRGLGPGDTLQIPRGTPHKMWNAGHVTAIASWRTRPSGRTAEWFRTVDRLGNGGTRTPPLRAMANALTNYSDVFELAIGPSQLRPLIHLALRTLALTDR
jgi:mannose-6-phosphate isomerase-like protein (cupin superfamily)